MQHDMCRIGQQGCHNARVARSGRPAGWCRCNTSRGGRRRARVVAALESRSFDASCALRARHAPIASRAAQRLGLTNGDARSRRCLSGNRMEDPAMEDSDEWLLPVWRANLVLLTREVGAATRLARMMTFSASYLKLMLSGQREFSEEFVRGIEAVTGLPAGWMDRPHSHHEIPAVARDAIDNEQPLARFRGTAHPVRKKTVLRPEPIFGQPAPARRIDDEPLDVETHRRHVHFRKVRELAVQDVRRFERHLMHAPVELATMRAKIEDLSASADLDERIEADLAGRLEQIDKHRELLLRHVERLLALLGQLGEQE